VLNFKGNRSYTFRDLITVESNLAGLKRVDARNVRRVDERENNERRESIRVESG
jgi:hypothetical protein